MIMLNGYVGFSQQCKAGFNFFKRSLGRRERVVGRAALHAADQGSIPVPHTYMGPPKPARSDP